MLDEYTAMYISKSRIDRRQKKLDQPYRININNDQPYWVLRKLRLSTSRYPKKVS